MVMKTESQVRQYQRCLELMIVGGIKTTSDPITQLLACDLVKRLDVVRWVLGGAPDDPRHYGLEMIAKMEEEPARHGIDFEKAKKEIFQL